MKIGLSFLPPGIDDRHTGKLVVDIDPNFYDAISEIPGYAYSPKVKKPCLPRAWPAVLSIGTLAKQWNFPLAPDEEVLAWYKSTAADWKSLRDRSVQLGEGSKAEGLSYYPHQLAGAQWLLGDGEVTGRVLLDQTGAGKTGTFIAAIQQGKLHSDGPVLVVCPESVMTTGWAQSLKVFAPEMNVMEITGTPLQRKKKFSQIADGEVDVAIIGYALLRQYTRFEALPGHALKKCIACGGPRLTVGEIDQETGKVIPTINPETGKEIKEITVAQCQAHHKELNDIGWSVIIADEIHRAMNAKSQTTQALWGVAHYGPSKPRRWGATGTPVSTHVEQIWPILHYIDPVSWTGKSNWIKWYCDSGKNNWGFFEVFGIKPKRMDEFQATFKAVSRRILKEQVLDLPPKIRWGSLEERITMGGEQLRVYNQMKDEMVAEVKEGVITAANLLVKARRLSMLASGTGFPIGDDGEMGLKMPSSKVDALISMWKDGEWEGEQVALLFASLKALRMTEDALYSAKLIHPQRVSIIAGDVPQSRRTEDINDFQSGRRPVVLLTYAAGGTGITLTAASTVIVFERDWSPILNAQGEDRFHRIGSERHKAIVYRDLVVGNSIEVKQLDRMAENAEKLESIVHDKDKLLDLFGG